MASAGNHISLLVYSLSAGGGNTTVRARALIDTQLGGACTANTDCVSNFCVNNVCCQSSCNPASANTQCAAGTGVCSIPVSCIGPNSDCDGDANNGCEAPWTGAMCGGCGPAFTCSTTNTTATSCDGTGSCLDTCVAGFDNCDNTRRANGCNVNITTVAHCGSCGNVCATPTTCAPTEVCDSGTTCRAVTLDQCATPFCGLGAAGCAGTGLDSDGDGLSDAWESQGYIDVNCNGQNDGEGVDVQLPGADVNVPDLYVELDYFEKLGFNNDCTSDADCTVKGETCIATKCTHTHKPLQASLDRAQPPCCARRRPLRSSRIRALPSPASAFTGTRRTRTGSRRRPMRFGTSLTTADCVTSAT